MHQMGNGAELALGGHLRHLLENFRIVHPATDTASNSQTIFKSITSQSYTHLIIGLG
jgi:hypothetical protein